MSKLAERVGFLIKKAYPSHRLISEHYVYFQYTKLFFDYFLPELGVVIEVQGEQHFEFNKFYHSSKSKFEGQKYRDNLKKQWCAVENIGMLQLSAEDIDSLTEDALKYKILEVMP